MNQNDNINQYKFQRREPVVFTATPWKKARKRVYWREAVIMAAIAVAIVWGLTA